MSEETQRALIKQNRAEKMLRGLVLVFFLYMMAVGTFSAIYTYRTQSAIAKNQAINAKASEDRFKRYTEENARQHQLTQQYVKCIATVLLKPVGQRTQEDFNACGVNAHVDLNTKTSTPGNTTIPTNSNTTKPSSSTSAPPDPKVSSNATSGSAGRAQPKQTVPQPSLTDRIIQPVKDIVNRL